MNTLILCNGTAPSRTLLERSRLWADYFIAADGGANIAKSLDTLPDVVVGDLDSFDPADEEPFGIIFKPGQETNDLEKALKIALKENSDHVLVLGATGKRLDHTLKNLSVLKQFNDRFETLVFRDDFGDMLLIPNEFQADFEIGKQISLFPLSGIVEKVSTDGLKYPLREEALENGVRDGSSNEVVSTPVKITHETGDLLLFVVH